MRECIYICVCKLIRVGGVNPSLELFFSVYRAKVFGSQIYFDKRDGHIPLVKMPSSNSGRCMRRARASAEKRAIDAEFRKKNLKEKLTKVEGQVLELQKDKDDLAEKLSSAERTARNHLETC